MAGFADRLGHARTVAVDYLERAAAGGCKRWIGQSHTETFSYVDSYVFITYMFRT